MLSLIISIASLVALIAGVAYLAYIYLPKITEMFNGAYDLIIALSASLPDWLLQQAKHPPLKAICRQWVKANQEEKQKEL